jgi:hypothetical protein
MGRSIAFVQPRGGIGKSTSVVQLAASLAATRPDLTVIVVDASLHGDASTLLLGGMQEPKNSPSARSHGEELCAAQVAAGKSTFTLMKAFAGTAATAAPTTTRATGWGRMLSSSNGSTNATAAPTVALTHADILAAYAASVRDAYPSSDAPSNLYVVVGGATLTGLTSEQAVRASQTMGSAFAAAPDNVVYILDTDAELCERPASACAAAAAGGLALLSSANWSDLMRSLTDPINGITVALAPPFPPKKIERVIFTRVAKTRNEQTTVAGAPVSPFKPVNAALSAIEQIITYVHDRAQAGGPMQPYVDANTTVRQFVEDHVIVVPDLPENIINASVLNGTPVAYMDTGGAVTTDALGAAQQQLAFAAARLV